MGVSTSQRGGPCAPSLPLLCFSVSHFEMLPVAVSSLCYTWAQPGLGHESMMFLQHIYILEPLPTTSSCTELPFAKGASNPAP